MRLVGRDIEQRARPDRIDLVADPEFALPRRDAVELVAVVGRLGVVSLWGVEAHLEIAIDEDFRRPPALGQRQSPSSGQ